jgi:hypothetical protein
MHVAIGPLNQVRLFTQREGRFMSRLILISLLAAVLLVGSPVGQADIVLSAVDSGFVTMAGGSAKGDGTLMPGATYNYSVGYELHYSTGALGMPPGSTPLAPMDRNNYFVFDLSSLGGAPIASATLLLPAGMLESVDGVEVFDVVAPAAPGPALGDAGALKAAHGAGPGAFDSPGDMAVGIAAALYGNIEGGAGFVLGSKAITPADDGLVVSIALSPLGVAYLNGFMGGPAILGGSVPSIMLAAGTPQQPFGLTAPIIPGSGPTVPKLDVTVIPETTSLLLVGVVAVMTGGGAVCARWRR